MSAREDEIIATGTQIVWLLQETTGFDNASGQDSLDFYTSVSASSGLFVGDLTTDPNLSTDEARTTWEDNNVNSFRTSRGSTMLVRKRDMQIVFGGNRPPVDTILEEIANVAP